jgi:hypothetical protein
VNRKLKFTLNSEHPPPLQRLNETHRLALPRCDKFPFPHHVHAADYGTDRPDDYIPHPHQEVADAGVCRTPCNALICSYNGATRSFRHGDRYDCESQN